MKILFLHLSDAHIRENTEHEEIGVESITNSLTQMGEFDECVIVFSGDVVQSGEAEQYKNANLFIEKLIGQIKNKYLPNKDVKVMVAPGNHDNLVADPSRGLQNIAEYYKQRETDRRFYDDLAQLENFYKFASKYNCYENDRIVDVKLLTFGSFTLRVNLINSAPFSLLGGENADKGLHYLPKNEMRKLVAGETGNFTISILHHSAEWFSDKSKNELYNKLYATSNLIFVGHEHFSLSEYKNINALHNVDVSSGVALHGTKEEHGFNALILDTNAQTLYGQKYIHSEDIYKPQTNIDTHSVIFSNKYNFAHTKEFKCLLESDIGERSDRKYSDYFVFPTMEAKNLSGELKNLSIFSEDQFVEFMRSKKKILIEGDCRSGKTTLSKHLCDILSMHYVTLRLEGSDFCDKNNMRIIQNALKDQYGPLADMDKFIQIERSAKILIIDDYDSIKNRRWENFWNQYSDYFEHIILFCGVDWTPNIKEKMLDGLLNNESFNLKISPFYYEKRLALIQKICNNRQFEDSDDVKELPKKINNDISDQVKLFQLTPDFIHQYVDYYLNFSHLKANNESNVFNKVFETNIVVRLTKHIPKDDVGEAMVVLGFLARHMHFSKQCAVPINDFSKIVAEYNQKYDNNVSDGVILEAAIKANILKHVKQSLEIRFCDETLLSYFMAHHLHRMLNEGEGDADFKHILTNICFQPNGDIVLFLSYIANNVNILNPILYSLKEHMCDWEQLNFDENNVSYLSKMQAAQPPLLPTEKDKKQLCKDRDSIEKNVVEDRDSGVKEPYSYDDAEINSFSNKVVKAINYLALIAKILPNFRHVLKKEQKQEIVSLLYEYPNKLLYFMCKDIDDNSQLIVDEVLKSNNKTREGRDITKELVLNGLQWQSMVYIFTIYNFIASTSATSKTIDDLDKINYFNYEQNSNYRLQNLLMEENAGRLEELAAKAKRLMEDSDLEIVKNMTTLIVRKYFLYHDVKLVGKAQGIVDYFFKDNEKEKRAIKMLQAKNKIVKK